jgi:mitogen-activated protein kinase kinase
MDGKGSGPTSAGSQYSAFSLASQYGLSKPQGTPDPSSAVGSLYSERSEGGVGMERDGSMNGLEAFDKLSLEKGRTLDVEDLDDDGWRIASMEKRIEEMGSLGEGAGGAVTRCKLKGGNTVFALKVYLSHAFNSFSLLTSFLRSSRRTRTLMSRNKSFEN